MYICKVSCTLVNDNELKEQCDTIVQIVCFITQKSLNAHKNNCYCLLLCVEHCSWLITNFIVGEIVVLHCPFNFMFLS